VLVRVWLPDRPGALGLVASRIGAVDGDIVGIDVLERGDGVVVDEFAVEVENQDLLELMVREIEEVDGASVEEVRTVGSFPDPRLDALDSAEQLCAATSVDALVQILVDHLQAEFLADWTVLVASGEVAATAGDGHPEPGMLTALVSGMAASPLVAGGTSGPDDLAIATLPTHDATLILGRAGRQFRRRERLQLLALTRIADRSWSLLSA
jgi:hypothetical protein